MTEDEKILRRNYINTFATDDGKKVLDDLSKFCHENDQTVIPGENDKSILRAGERNVILRIRRLLRPSKKEGETVIKHNTTEI
jgi:hypothetical protein